jgi:hypothetical protein
VPFGVGHFLRRADLVGVEVVVPGVSLRQFGVGVDTGQGRVAAEFVDVQAVQYLENRQDGLLLMVQTENTYLINFTPTKINI